jgi:hypothetical protein
MNFLKYIRNILDGINVGAVTEIDLKGHERSTARAAINKSKGDREFATRVDFDGNFIVKRVK